MPRVQAHAAAVEVPETRYTKFGDSYIAYQVFGDGPIDFLLVQGFASHVDGLWEYPPAKRYFTASHRKPCVRRPIRLPAFLGSHGHRRRAADRA
jgi:hypothetical protein